MNRLGCKILLWVGLCVSSSSVASDETTTDQSPPLLTGRHMACDVLIAIDQPLWEQNDQNMTLLADLAKSHVKGLNDIFSQQVFVDDYEAFYFRLKRIQVAFGSCESHLFDKDYEKNCTEQRETFLNAFDRYDTSEFCLAYMITYLDFHNGTAGLASVGTACRPIRNTGFITMLNFGQERNLQESVITLAHEVAHNFNASHDNDHPDAAECFNQGFIMDELYNSTREDNGDKFSPCSLRSMKAQMVELLANSQDCFNEVIYDEEDSELTISLCGNGVVEEGEECDCGLNYEDCDDPCCYPAIISQTERSRNETAFPCARNTRPQCLTRPGLLYGFYLPWAVIAAAIVIIGVILYRDWHRDKKLFTHITNNRIRIK